MKPSFNPLLPTSSLSNLNKNNYHHSNHWNHLHPSTSTYTSPHSSSSSSSSSLQYSQLAQPSESTPLLQPQLNYPLHTSSSSTSSSSSSSSLPFRPLFVPTSNESLKFSEFLKQWKKASDLDYFYSTLYSYYYGKGALAILMRQSAFQLRILFSLSLLIFLTHGIDFQQLPTLTSPTSISKLIQSPQLSITLQLALYLFLFLWCAQWVKIIYDHREYIKCRQFYQEVLNIQESDVATIQWSEILVRLEKYSPIPTDQVQITNRIMRKENLSIALFSHPQLLNLELPLLGPFFSLPLQYAIDMSVFGTIFKALTTHPSIRGYGIHKLTEQLKKKFIFMGILYAFTAPFLVCILITYFFFRYGDEFYRNPSSMGSRRFSLLACWKFRKYNEVIHLFEHRLNASYQPTLNYLTQFPSEYMAITIKLLNFIFGALAGILLFISIMYPDTLIYLELGFHRTPVFFLGVFTSILAMLRSLRPQDHTLFDPVDLMDQIIQKTHYQPTAPWYSKETKQELSHFFPLRLNLYFTELLSFFLAPYVLCFQLPNCAERILLYFADHLVYKEPLGYILDLAAFEVVDTSDDKLVQSMVYFKSTHPAWQPPSPSKASNSIPHSSTGPSMVNMLQQFYASDEDEFQEEQ